MAGSRDAGHRTAGRTALAALGEQGFGPGEEVGVDDWLGGRLLGGAPEGDFPQVGPVPQDAQDHLAGERPARAGPVALAQPSKHHRRA